MAKAKPLEESLEQLDEILKKMEDRQLPLEEAFALYQEGVRLVKAASSSIDKVEKKLIEIQGGQEDAGL